MFSCCSGRECRRENVLTQARRWRAAMRFLPAVGATLLEWGVSNGASTANVRIYEANGLRGLVAVSDTPAGGELVTVPLRLGISSAARPPSIWRDEKPDCAAVPTAGRIFSRRNCVDCHQASRPQTKRASDSLLDSRY